MRTDVDAPRIVVVGPCASDKSTLVRGLLSHGFDARVCAQEHSAVSTLWRHQGHPTLIGLTAGLETVRIRREPTWPQAVYAAQVARLSDAYAHADLIIATDDVSSRDVLSRVIDFLSPKRHASSGGTS